MQVHSRNRKHGIWTLKGAANPVCQLVLVFASRSLLSDPKTWLQLRDFYPDSHLIACSTAGEINDVSVYDESIVCTGIWLEHSNCMIAKAPVCDTSDSEELGLGLGAQLPLDGLVHIFVFADGSKVNGSALLRGLLRDLPVGVGVTGGLAGDGSNFTTTAVCVDEMYPHEQVAAIGLYGSRLKVGYGSGGGWDSFGVERVVTKSHANVLHELDGTPALDLYKKYLGPQAADLPASALRFPLAIRSEGNSNAPIVRTILSIDEAAKTMTFAGEIPQGYRARLMSANVERLLDGASNAALAARSCNDASPAVAILVSCVGRKLVLNQRVEEEVEVVRGVMGNMTLLTGFYSYGEISPFSAGGACEFHNQTMTITTLSES